MPDHRRILFIDPHLLKVFFMVSKFSLFFLFKYCQTFFKDLLIVLSEASWDTLQRFLHKVGWSLVFDLNSLYRTNGIWNSSNAEALIRYSILKNYTMAGWELGNGKKKVPDLQLRDFLTCSEGISGPIMKGFQTCSEEIS